MDPKPEKKIELAVAAESDGEFLCSVYAATRADEVRSFGWDDAQAKAFLGMQFAMRTRSYEMQFPSAVTYIVLFGGTRAGTMIIDRTDGYISLTDIAVLPAFCGMGIATYLIRMLQDEAATSGKLLLIHGVIDENVHMQNTIQLAYEFQKTGKQFDLIVYPTARHGLSKPAAGQALVFDDDRLRY